MDNLYLEFILEKFIDEKMPTARCCGSCQGGMINPAVCMFLCIGVDVKEVHKWYSENAGRIRSEWEYKIALEEEAYYKMMEETMNADL